jgi:hypothetical protein
MKRMPAWAIALIAAVGFAACEPRPPKPKVEGVASAKIAVVAVTPA